MIQSDQEETQTKDMRRILFCGSVFFMKRLVSPATVLILPSRPRGGRISHIPAYDNNVREAAINFFLCESGNYVVAFYAFLNSSELFFYPFTQPMNYPDAFNVWNLQWTFFPWPNRNYGSGIYFNDIARGMVYDKVSGAEWENWLEVR